MEEKQVKIIVDNLHRLIQLTDCNINLVSILLNHKILSATDIDNLMSNSRMMDRAYDFYRVLMTRVDAYKHLLFALEETGQMVALGILRNDSSEGGETGASTSNESIDRLTQQINRETLRRYHHPRSQDRSVSFDVKTPCTLFSGREEELQKLHQIVSNTKDDGMTVISQITSVSGLGGIGKTQLARKYVEKYASHFENNVIWIEAETDEKLSSSFRQLASDALEIKTKTADGRDKGTKYIVSECYKHFVNSRCIFVFDNAEIGNYLKPYLPNRTKCVSVLITSRNREWGAGVEVVDLGIFKTHEAINLVKTGLGLHDENHISEIKLLVKRLHFFPLALQQAISYISNTCCSISDYLAALETQETKLLSFHLPESEDLRNDYMSTTINVWQMTMHKLENIECGSMAIKMLEIIAYFEPDKIPLDTLIRIDSNKKCEIIRGIKLLGDYCMIDGNVSQKMFSIHRHVQRIVQLRIEHTPWKLGMLSKATGIQSALLFALGSTRQGRWRKYWILKKALLIFKHSLNEGNISHAMSVWKHAESFPELAIQYRTLPSKMISELTNLYRLDEGIKFGNDILSTFQTNLTSVRLVQLILLFELYLAIAYVLNHRFVGVFFIILLGVRERHSNELLTWKQDPALQVQFQVGAALFVQGKFLQGLNLCNRTCTKMVISRKILSATLLATILMVGFMILWHSYSFIFYGYACGSSAIDCCCILNCIYLFRLIHISVRKNDELDMLSKAAEMACHVGNFENADKGIQSVMSSLIRVHRKTYIDYIARMRLGIIKASVGSSEGLEILRCLHLEMASSSKSHHASAEMKNLTEQLLHNLSHCLLQYKYYEEGLQVSHKLYEFHRERYGENSSYCLRSRNLVGSFLLGCGKLEEALVIHEQTYNKLNEMLGPYNLLTLQVLGDKGLALSRMGSHQEALAAYDELFHKLNMNLEDYNMVFLKIKLEHAETFESGGHFVEALEILRKVEGQWSKKYGEQQAVYKDCQEAIKRIYLRNVYNKGKWNV